MVHSTVLRHGPQHRAAPSKAQERRIINGVALLDQVADVTLPVTCLCKPRKGSRKGRIGPSVCDPGRMVQHAQGAQRLDEPDFPCVEACKLRVPLHELGPLPPLIIRGACEQHPKVLYAWPGDAVVKIDEYRAAFVPEHIAKMAVPMDAQLRHRSDRIELLLHPLEELQGRFLISILEGRRQKLAREHLGTRLPSEALDRESSAKCERSNGAHLVDTCKTAPENGARVGRVELGRAAALPGERRKAELAKAKQGITPDRDRSRDRQIGACKLDRKGMFLAYLGVCPARRTVKLQNQRPFAPP